MPVLIMEIIAITRFFYVISLFFRLIHPNTTILLHKSATLSEISWRYLRKKAKTFGVKGIHV